MTNQELDDDGCYPVARTKAEIEHNHRIMTVMRANRAAAEEEAMLARRAVVNAQMEREECADTLDKLFGPKADYMLAHKLFLNEPKEYARYRAQAVERGWLAK